MMDIRRRPVREDQRFWRRKLTRGTAAPIGGAGRVPSPWRLLVGLLLLAGAVLTAASAGWVGVVMIVAVLGWGCVVLLRWSAWPRSASDTPSS